ncbi:hypothetical protein QYE76_008635 [Lolium multiflorum]|uniref:Reverse transcriptase domain-containing protein n=1 Tax=Lolium multiflorum TaxID=4521 RepID=A0AAD8X066_LOLMU|nr:hypothetical protein QYE76_008635 [Lolium multiflorum]
MEAVQEAWQCDSLITDPFKRLDALLRNSALFLQAWGQRRIGDIKIKLAVANSVILRLELAQDRRTLSAEEVGNELVTEQGRKEECFFQFYNELLGSIQNRDSVIDLNLLNLPHLDLHAMDVIFSEDEVWGVIKELPPDRAPGPDGFTGVFYQMAWPVIKNDVMAAILKLFVGDGRRFGKLNKALITLIPKKPDANVMGDYRPISLVHSFAKLFSKVLANRVRPRLANLVSANQSAFIRGRSLHDNFLLVRQAPVWLLEDAAKWMRTFLRAGKSTINGGQCPVAWDRVYKPLSLGGLGIKDLRLQGLVLRTRWEWLRRTDSSRPWHGLPMMKDAEAEGVFRSLASIKLGSGKSVLFWTDQWINGATVADLAPSVLATVGGRQRNSRTVADGLLNDSWVLDISRTLAVQGVVESAGLWMATRNVQLEVDGQDSFSWPCAANNQYSAKDTYMALCQGSIREVWFRCFSLVGIQIDVPDGTENLEVWWLKARKKFRHKERRLFDSLVMAVCWSLWKQRNAYVFNNVMQQLSVVDLAHRIVDEFNSWVAVRAGVGVGVGLGRKCVEWWCSQPFVSIGI